MFFSGSVGAGPGTDKGSASKVGGPLWKENASAKIILPKLAADTGEPAAEMDCYIFEDFFDKERCNEDKECPGKKDHKY